MDSELLENRSVRKEIRLTPTEANTIKEIANKAGYKNISTYMRVSALKGHHQDETLRKISVDLSRYIALVNQIAKAANTKGFDPAKVKDITDTADKIFDLGQSIDTKYKRRRKRIDIAMKAQTKEAKKRRAEKYKVDKMTPAESLLNNGRLLYEYAIRIKNEEVVFSETQWLERILVALESDAEICLHDTRYIKAIEINEALSSKDQKISFDNIIRSVNSIDSIVQKPTNKKLTEYLRELLGLIKMEVKAKVGDLPEIT